MQPKVRSQWRRQKIKLIAMYKKKCLNKLSQTLLLIAMYICDEILVRKRVGMKCFITGTIPCSILLAAQEMAIKKVEAILRGMNATDIEIKATVGYDISFATTKWEGSKVWRQPSLSHLFGQYSVYANATTHMNG